MQVIGDQQQAGDLVQPGRFFIEQGPDLIEAVELEELDTAATIDLIAGQLLPDPLRHAVGTGIAISHSITEHLARRIQQYKVDPPGVDTHRIERNAGGINFFQPEQDIGKEPFRFPAIMPIAMHHAIGKAMHLLHGDILIDRIIAGPYYPPAGGT